MPPRDPEIALRVSTPGDDENVARVKMRRCALEGEAVAARVENAAAARVETANSSSSTSICPATLRELDKPASVENEEEAGFH